MAPEGFDAYLRRAPDDSFCEWIRSRSEPYWSQMMTHRFTEGMASGSLPAQVLRRYLVFESDFVEAAVTIFGYALVKAPSISEQARLAEMIRGLTTDQLEYFERVFHALGMGAAERVTEPTAMPVAVVAFRESMLALAAHGSYEEIIAGMAAAEWMYLSWCQAAHARGPRDPIAAEWVALHVGSPFAEQVGWLRDQLDRSGPHLSPWRQERLASAFRRTLALEIGFHDAAFIDHSTTRHEEEP